MFIVLLFQLSRDHANSLQTKTFENGINFILCGIKIDKK